MLPHPVLAELGEEVLERLVAKAPHPMGRQLDLPALVGDQARVLEALDHLGEALELAGGIVAEVATERVDVDLAQRGGRRRRREQVLHPLELSELPSGVSRAGHRERSLALEAEGIAPPHLRECGAQVGAEPVHRPAQVHVLEHGLGEALELGTLLRREGAPHRLGGRHLAGHLLEEVVEALGAGEEVAELVHELLEGRIEVLAALALLEHLAQRVHGGPGAGDLLGVRVAQQLRHPLEVGVGDLLADLLLQLLEGLAGLRGGELVGAQRAHASSEVVGEQVEGHAPLGHDLVGHLLSALVARGGSVGSQLVDPAALEVLDLPQPVAVASELAIRISLLQQLLASASRLVEEVAQAIDALAIGQLEAIAQQSLEGVAQVAIG